MKKAGNFGLAILSMALSVAAVAAFPLPTSPLTYDVSADAQRKSTEAAGKTQMQAVIHTTCAACPCMPPMFAAGVLQSVFETSYLCILNISPYILASNAIMRLLLIFNPNNALVSTFIHPYVTLPAKHDAREIEQKS